jgi:hypothetical protein
VDPRKLAVFSVGMLAAACGGHGAGPTPSAISLVSGNGQTDKPGAALPDLLVVKVTDTSGAPVSGFQVGWSSPTGSVGAPATRTEANGIASVSATLGPGGGAHTFTATAPGLAGSPVTFAATASCAGTCLATPVIVASPTPACGGRDPCPTSRPATCTKPVVQGPAGLVHHAVHTVNELVSFDVPPGTASLTIVEQAISAPDTITINGTIAIANAAVPDKVRDPLGSIVYDDNPPSPPPPDPSGELVFSPAFRP